MLYLLQMHQTERIRPLSEPVRHILQRVSRVERSQSESEEKPRVVHRPDFRPCKERRFDTSFYVTLSQEYVKKGN